MRILLAATAMVASLIPACVPINGGAVEIELGGHLAERRRHH